MMTHSRSGCACVPGRSAFTLLEVTVLLVVLSVLIAVMVPASLKVLAAQRVSATRTEMTSIFEGITGHPERGHAGFLGDMGRVPLHLSELVSAGDLSLYTTATTYQVGMGWNGPYVMKSLRDLTSDAFGRSYEFNKDGDGKIRSAGSDGRLGTSDDIVYPPVGFRSHGSVRIELGRAGDFLVRLYYSNSGVEAYVEASEAPYVFENVHRGPHGVEILTVSEDDEETKETVGQAMIVLADQAGSFTVDF